MARLHKMEMYILDINEDFECIEDSVDAINESRCLVSLHPFNIQTVNFDWHDDHKLNMSNATQEDFKSMFPSEKASIFNKFACGHCLNRVFKPEP